MIGIEIKEIQARDTWALRQEVLRPGLSLEHAIFEQDSLPTTFHMGAFFESKLIGVASFQKESAPFLEDTLQFRLRGMATSPKFQKRGIGKKILENSYNHLHKKHVTYLWCNAREAAIGFYTKLGFKTHGNRFNIPGVGLHFVMSYNLKRS